MHQFCEIIWFCNEGILGKDSFRASSLSVGLEGLIVKTENLEHSGLSWKQKDNHMMYD